MPESIYGEVENKHLMLRFRLVCGNWKGNSKREYVLGYGPYDTEGSERQTARKLRRLRATQVDKLVFFGRGARIYTDHPSGENHPHLVPGLQRGLQRVPVLMAQSVKRLGRG